MAYAVGCALGSRLKWHMQLLTEGNRDAFRPLYSDAVVLVSLVA